MSRELPFGKKMIEKKQKTKNKKQKTKKSGYSGKGGVVLG
jgi:hypothetical protein